MITHGCSDQQVRPSVIAPSRQAWQSESPSTISGEQMSSRELTQSAQVNSNANGSTFKQVIFRMESFVLRTFVSSRHRLGHWSVLTMRLDICPSCPSRLARMC